MLENTLAKYKNGTIEAAQVIEELIDIAKQIKRAEDEGKELGLEEDELAFYDALRTNDSAAEVMQDDQLRELAQMLVQRVRNNVGVDWTVRKAAQARLRVEVKKALKKYGYPPDQQALATDRVLEQAVQYGDVWNQQVDGGASLVD